MTDRKMPALRQDIFLSTIFLSISGFFHDPANVVAPALQLSIRLGLLL